MGENLKRKDGPKKKKVPRPKRVSCLKLRNGRKVEGLGKRKAGGKASSRVQEVLEFSRREPERILKGGEGKTKKKEEYRRKRGLQGKLNEEKEAQ